MSTRPGAATQSRPEQRMVLLALVGIMLLGLILRMYRLGEQSLWWDDYNGLTHLTLEGFFASIAEARRMNPEGAPLYHVIQYLASFVIGGGEYPQRLLNVLISVAIIPVIFVVGRNSFGSTAGLVAALLMAMSPTHLYHAQSLRIYPLAVLVGAFALLTMERMLTQRRPKWLYLNAAANGALCMTHLLGLFGVLAQGTAVLLLLGLRHPRTVIRWSVVQFMCLLPSGFWVLTMRQRTAGDFWHFSFPDAGFVLRDLFGDDLTEFAVQRAGARIEWFGFHVDAPGVLGFMEMAMLASMMAATLWALTLTGYTLVRIRRQPDCPDASQRMRRLTLLLAFWALPVIYLLVFAYLWWPVVYARYTLYACLGLYVIVGGCIQFLKWRTLKVAAVAVLGILYAYQLTLLVTADTRTQWRQAAWEIVRHAGPDDIVLVGGYGPPEISHRTFVYHLPAEFDLPVSRSHSVYDTLEQIRCHFERHANTAPAPEAWLVYNAHYYQGRPGIVQQYFAANGIRFTSARYPAEEHLTVFRVSAWDTRPESFAGFAPPETQRYTWRDGYDARAAIERLELDATDPEVLFAFKRAFEDGIIMGHEAYVFGQIFIELDEFELAAHCLHLADEDESHHVSAFDWWHYHFARGDLEAGLRVLLDDHGADGMDIIQQVSLAFTLWALGEEEAALAAYRRVRPGLQPRFMPILYLMDALVAEQSGGPAAAARRYRATLLPHGQYRDDLLFRMSGQARWVSSCAEEWQAGAVQPSTLAEALATIASPPTEAE